MMRKILASISFAVFMYALLMWHSGYRFGTGDHVEYLPYVNYLHDQTLYKGDFFLQGLIKKNPNERTLFAYTILFFYKHLEIACFVIHFIVTVLLIMGLEKLGNVISGNLTITRVAVFINFILLFNRGIGDVELYGDALQSSSISVVAIAFALALFFKERFFLSVLLMAVASIIHPVEGLTVFLVMAACMVVFTFYTNVCTVKTLVTSFLLYTLTAGVFIAFLLSGKIDGINAFAGNFDSETFYRIYYVFRHPHHYVFAYQPVITIILFAVLVVLNMVYGISSNKKLFWFNAFSLAGILFYILCSDGLHLIDITNLQFYKVTQWTKFLGVLISVKYFFELFRPNLSYATATWRRPALMLALSVCIMAALFMAPGLIERKNVYYQFGPNWKAGDDAVNISLSIAERVNKNALFIHPFNCTELKYYGRVGSFVDWKAFLKNRGSIFEWYRRVQLVYGISLADKERGFNLQGRADDNFYNLSHDAALKLKNEGVTHILTTNKNWPYGRLLFKNNTYAVYQL